MKDKISKKILGEMKELLYIIIVSALIVIPIRFFFIEPYLVFGASMSPNFETGDYLLVNKISHKISDSLNRGDILIFKAPDSKKNYIKRLIALPGESIMIKDQKIYLKKINEDFRVLNEPYLKNISNGKMNSITLKENQYFMMGDNRGNSKDSRVFGPVNKESIIGEPLVQILPSISFKPESFNDYQK